MKSLIALALISASQISYAQTQFVPVLMYHQITDDKDPGGTVISKARFEEHIRYLKESGYTTLTVNEVGKFMRGEITVPEKSVAITIDDGWRSTFNAVKTLNDYQSKATLYIISGAFKDAEYLSAEEVSSLAMNPRIEIGAHTHTHFLEWQTNLDKIDYRIMAGEAVMSKLILGQIIGKPVTTISWPFGYSRPEAVQLAGNMGYTSTVMVNSDTRNTKGMSPLSIRRINIDGKCTVDDLRSMVETGNLEECNHDENDKKTTK